MRNFTLALAIAAAPAIAFADFCDLMAGSGAASCRASAKALGAEFFGSWLRIKPEMGTQQVTGKKSPFVAASTPASGVSWLAPSSGLGG